MTQSRQTTPAQDTTTNRHSTRVRTPLSRPGFIQTHTNSRRALEAPPASPLDSHSANGPSSTRSQGAQAETTGPKPTKSSSQSTAGSSIDPVIVVESGIDIVQDSDDENVKAEDTSKVDLDEFDNPKLHYHTPYKADDQVKPGALTYKCRWCPKSVQVNGSTNLNLKTHRDGAINRNQLRKSCPGQGKAIIEGANLPISSDDKAAAKEKKAVPTVTLTAYVTKGKFAINTMNKVFSQTWAAYNARKLYMSLQSKVILDIKKSNLKIGLIADVWTTKGNHKAFIGILVCYINKKWEYISQHLSLKYVSWHHNGKNLAAPFANVLAKHGLHNQITLTTDSGSNNFTMAKEMAQILRIKSGDFLHCADHHHRCFCHLLALFLGAGLRSLEPKQPLGAPKSVPNYFPTLEPIAEMDEDEAGPNIDLEMLQLDDVEDIEEVDPDDAEYTKEAAADNSCTDPSDGNIPTGGIGYTLLKVDYICRWVSSSSARRADFKQAAADKKHKGSLIAGYGIRWNVAYDYWQCAYAARRVIDQLLEDESDKYAGKSAARHFYKGYKILKKEWENEFLALTLSREDDGPNASMVLYKYRQLIDSLEKKKIAPEFAALKVMFNPMIKVAQKYLDIALGCTPILLATVVHPAWRMSLIKDKFPEHKDIALSLVQAAFNAKQEAHNRMLLEPAAPDSNGEDSDEEEFNYYPVKNGSSQDTNELKKYLEGAYPLGKKGDPLNWWMTHQSEFP
ncbi:hypothetical protein Pst134EA_028911 [Puccinia striiformis f. sp. tritici]|uniref:hypothetical protein n=1 Tax=Puccinia striiformis f. sp. tritici TaxID=168172 RepID=UPI002008D5B1|nr:hypothetical protein Pst134EA_028911 [Puccinia striiformis f. sp. tritici]KAH9446925.1 hypothetical protein Pst134EA_028911 [Puccinia striiformis f. sp. tritici]